MSVVLPPPPAALLELRAYRVRRTLGGGGQGIVFEVERVADGRVLALKMLRDAGSASDVERFLREARTLLRLSNASIVRGFDAGLLADGSPYLVMEKLEGRTLAEEIRSPSRAPLPRIVGWIQSVARALGEAHDLGLVHRDVKPSNIFLCGPRGRESVRVLDFGLVKDTGALPLTRTTSTFGTPRFMAPEQIDHARDVDGRADVFALGVVLYLALSGHYPWKSEDLADFALEVGRPPTRITTLVADLPPALGAVIERAMMVDPADRWPTMRAFADALQPFAEAGESDAVHGRRRWRVLIVAALATLAVGAAATVGGVIAVRARARAEGPGPDASPVVRAETDAGAQEEETSAIPVDAATVREAAAAALPLKASCRCYGSSLSRALALCTTPMPLRCACQRAPGIRFCPVPWTYDASGKGTCDRERDTFGGADRRSGGACEGYEDDARRSTRRASGTLDCSDCYGSVPPIVGAEGAACRGTKAFAAEGHWVDGKLSCTR